MHAQVRPPLLLPSAPGVDVASTCLGACRSLLPKEVLLTVFPLLVALLGSEFNVVHSYAAIAIEKLLSVKVCQPGLPLSCQSVVLSHLF